MNKYKIKISELDQRINIPVKIEYDLTGQEDLISQYEDSVTEQLINPIKKFETQRFSHGTVSEGVTETDINYNFYFFDYSTDVSQTSYSDSNLWVESYNFTTNPSFTGESFTDKEIYYNANSFKRSFFKLDFYDSKESFEQKIYFTVIIPTQQGDTVEKNIGTDLVPNNVGVRIPKFKLDFVGDKEGYFFYFTRDFDTNKIDTFYMSCKFFNAKIGQFQRFTNIPQSQMASKFNFRKEDVFYYKVFLNYQNYTYSIFNEFENKIGDNLNPINWYIYINP